MTTIVTPALSIVDGIITTTSNQVAEHFGKRHDNVLRAIRNLLSELPKEHRLNFEETFTEVVGTNGATRQDPAYRITRDGFTLLAMGFTGKEALQWKLAYINAFNQMEHALQTEEAPAKTKHQPKALPSGLALEQQDAIKALVKARVEACAADKQAKAAITCWSALKSKFGCTYKAIEPEQFTDALSLVARLPLEGELLHKALPPEPVTLNGPADRLELAFTLASEVANQASRTVFQAVMAGDDGWKHDRWLFCLNYDRNNQPTLPWAKVVARDALVISRSQLPHFIQEPDAHFTSKELADLASACNQKLAQRMSARTR